MGQMCENKKVPENVDAQLQQKEIELFKDLESFLPVAFIKVNKNNELSRESTLSYKKFPIGQFFDDDNNKYAIFKQLEILLKVIDICQVIFKIRKVHLIEGIALINFDRFYVYNNELVYIYNEKIAKKYDINKIINRHNSGGPKNNKDESIMSIKGGFSLHQAIFESPKQTHEENKSSMFYLYYLKRFVVKLLEKNGLISVLKKDREKLKYFSNLNSFKALKYSLGNILFNMKEMKELKKEGKLDFTFVKHNLDCIFPENGLKFVFLYDAYSLSSCFTSDMISVPLCIGCVEQYLSAVYPANIKGLRLSTSMEAWKQKTKTDVKVLVNYLKYFNVGIDLDPKRTSEAELLLKAFSIEVYKKESEPGIFTFEFCNNIDLSFRYSNTTNAERVSSANQSEN